MKNQVFLIFLPNSNRTTAFVIPAICVFASFLAFRSFFTSPLYSRIADYVHRYSVFLLSSVLITFARNGGNPNMAMITSITCTAVNILPRLLGYDFVWFTVAVAEGICLAIALTLKKISERNGIIYR